MCSLSVRQFTLNAKHPKCKTAAPATTAQAAAHQIVIASEKFLPVTAIATIALAV